jgi:hypothetical protein
MCEASHTASSVSEDLPLEKKLGARSEGPEYRSYSAIVDEPNQVTELHVKLVKHGRYMQSSYL